MKKIASILLLSILLFNLAGYSFLFQCLINNADTQLVKQLDSNTYNDQDLIEVKVPLNMPYITDTKDFERIDGQLEYKGVHYNYVKRKVSGNTLYVLCLPNASATQLYNAKATYGKEVNDLPCSKKSSQEIQKLSFGSEYNIMKEQCNIVGFVLESISYSIPASLRLPNPLSDLPEQPPRPAC